LGFPTLNTLFGYLRRANPKTSTQSGDECWNLRHTVEIFAAVFNTRKNPSKKLAQIVDKKAL
jgi:hypothetical protein